MTYKGEEVHIVIGETNGSGMSAESKAPGQEPSVPVDRSGRRADSDWQGCSSMPNPLHSGDGESHRPNA